MLTVSLVLSVIASEAKQSHCQKDCFVAKLLAMTVFSLYANVTKVYSSVFLKKCLTASVACAPALMFWSIISSS